MVTDCDDNCESCIDWQWCSVPEEFTPKTRRRMVAAIVLNMQAALPNLSDELRHAIRHDYIRRQFGKKSMSAKAKQVMTPRELVQLRRWAAELTGAQVAELLTGGER